MSHQYSQTYRTLRTIEQDNDRRARNCFTAVLVLVLIAGIVFKLAK